MLDRLWNAPGRVVLATCHRVKVYDAVSDVAPIAGELGARFGGTTELPQEIAADHP